MNDQLDEWFEKPIDPQWEEALKPVPRPSLFEGTVFYWAVSCVYVLIEAVQYPVYWMLSAFFAVSAVGFTVSVQVLFYLGALLLPVCIYLLRHADVVPVFRLNPVSLKQTAMTVVTACVGVLAANSVTLIWLLLLEALGADISGGGDVFSGSLALDIFVVAVLPGICEELLFRGMMLSVFERWGTWKAIWISAVLFMGLHGSIEGAPAELMLGAALGYAAVSTNSLYASMMLHTAYNAVTLILGYMGGQQEAAVIESESLLASIGGMAGAAWLALESAVLLLVFLYMLRLLDRSRRAQGLPFGNDQIIEKKKLERSEIIVAASALGTLLWLYAQDFMDLFL